MFKTVRDSKLALPLLSGFIALIGIILFLWLTNINQIRTQFDIVQSNKLSAQKMHLIAMLIEVVRERTRLTNEIFLTDDIFTRDDIKMELNELATQFVQFKNQLENLPLDDYELRILASQNELIPIIVETQRKIADFALSNDANELRRGQKLLYGKVLPDQGKLVDSFMKLLSRLQNNINDASLQAERQQVKSRSLNYLFLIIFLIIAIVIIFYTLKKALQIENKLQIEKYIAKVTLMSIGDAVIITDQNSRVIEINKTAQEIFDLSRHLVKDQTVHDNIRIEFDNSSHNFKHYLDLALSTGGIQIINDTTSVYSARRDKRCYIDIMLSPINDSKKIIGCIITLRDVTEKIKRHKQLEYQAKYDALTGLLNRHAFEDEFQAHYNNLTETNCFSLSILDLDHFKIINDTCGHQSGDIVLSDIARLLESCLRKNDVLARIGGDEFTIIINDCNAQHTEKILDQFLTKLTQYHYECDNQVFNLGCSIGITEVTLSTDSYADALHLADKACYRAKNSGRNQIQVQLADEDD